MLMPSPLFPIEQASAMDTAFTASNFSSSASATSSITWNSDGSVTRVNSFTQFYGWFDPVTPNIGDDYEIMFMSSGSPAGVTFNVWIPLNTSPQVTVTDTSIVGGPETRGGTYIIRNIATQITLIQGSWAVSATRETP